MKSFHWTSAVKSAAGRHASRRGAFSTGLVALAIAVVVAFNLLLAQLPAAWTQFDMTGSGIYTVTDASRDYLAALDQDVEIHVLTNEDTLDTRIARFLEIYTALSDHLTVTYTNPTVFPSVLSTYGVEAESVVVTCAATGRQESFAIGDIIGFDEMSYYYYGTYTETDFDGEGLLTSAVDGVLTYATRAVYQTVGHGETSLPPEVEALFKKVHMSVSAVNLLIDGGIPADCSLLVLSAPERDLADDELAMLRDYLSGGGQVLYTMAGQLEPLPNLETLCADYGMAVADGMVADTTRYYQNNPYLFFPLVDGSVDAAGGLSSDATVLFYAARGFTLTDPAREGIAVQSFLATSPSGVAVVDETTQAPGTYAVGAVATEETDGGAARLTVYGAGSLIDAGLTASFSNIDNHALFMASATCGFADVNNLSIEPVSLLTPTNTIPTGGLWALLFILVIPVGLLATGFVRWMRRRKL